MGDDGNKPEHESDNKKVFHVYPLIRHSDMNSEMRADVIELIITACEKYAQNYEQAARLVKDNMDKKYGTYWHVVIGEGFGFDVSFETKNILYMFFAGNLAIVLWKCS